MSVTIADVMNLPVMRKSRIIAGKLGVSNIVSGLAMLEDTTSLQFLQKNSFILTNGQVIASNLANLIQIMQSLQAHGVAGLALKIGGHLREIPPIMIELADIMALPIILLPHNVTSTQLINAISYALFRSEDPESSVNYEVDLVRSIIVEGDDWRSLKSRLATAGIDVRNKMGVVLIKRLDGEMEDNIGPICNRLGFTYAFPLYENFVACINLTEKTANDAFLAEKAHQLKTALEQEHPGSMWRMGVGSIKDNLLMISLSYKAAQAALCYGIAADSKNAVISCGDMGIYSILLQPNNRQKVKAHLTRVSNLLERHDETYGTELAKTLRIYAMHHNSISETAQELFVHANTVRYRINSIKKIIESEFVPEDASLNIELIRALTRWFEIYNAETKHPA